MLGVAKLDFNMKHIKGHLKQVEEHYHKHE
jgi:hypothetical protein